ncbi:hypothetical protein L195_g045165, partial [Trifolium pratense]
SAYIHPVFKGDEDTDNDVMSQEWKDEPVIVQSPNKTPVAEEHTLTYQTKWRWFNTILNA